MKRIDWSPEEDNNLKSKEIEIHQLYHSEDIKRIKTPLDVFGKRKKRIKALERLARLIGGVKGNVLEVGAGDGWCSAYILKEWASEINEIHIMEINDAAIDGLIPHTLKTCNVEDNNISLIKGSFNSIALSNHYDCVVAMGAIHHSSNLHKTLSSIYECLKPGGWLIAQEPYMPDTTQNDFYFERSQQIVNFKGLIEVKNIERSDVFYRECEYRTAAFHSGFEVNWIKLNTSLNSPKQILKSLVKNLKSKNSNNSMPSNAILYFQKPRVPVPSVTAWEK